MSKGIFDFEWLADFFRPGFLWLLHLHRAQIWILIRSRREIIDCFLKVENFLQKNNKLGNFAGFERFNSTTTSMQIANFWIQIFFLNVYRLWWVFRWSDGEFAICVKWSMLALVLIQWVEVQYELEFKFSYAIQGWSFFVK